MLLIINDINHHSSICKCFIMNSCCHWLWFKIYSFCYHDDDPASVLYVCVWAGSAHCRQVTGWLKSYLLKTTSSKKCLQQLQTLNNKYWPNMCRMWTSKIFSTELESFLFVRSLLPKLLSFQSVCIRNKISKISTGRPVSVNDDVMNVY